MIVWQVKAIREEYGLGMEDAKKAIQIANDRFDGDINLGVRWVHADGFAVSVRGDRAAWNDAWARGAGA